MPTAPATAVPAPHAAVSVARRRPWRLQVLHQFQHGDRLPRLARVVLCLFIWCLISPALLAAQTGAPHPTAPAARPASAEAAFSTALAQIEAKLVRLQNKLAKAESTRIEDADLQHWRQRVEQLDARARQTFDQLAQHLRETGMPPEILQRHQAMVTAYAAEVATLRQHLTTLAAPGAPAGRTDNAARALQHLQALQPARATPPVDPAPLPFRVPDGTVRKPRETPKEFESFRATPHATMLAAAALLPGLLAAPFAPLPATPTSDDLAPTEDVQFSAEIRALATSLGPNPVAIFNWVHDHIEFLPTYGAIQGAHLTLQTKRGNALDTASLLIALLRAARIPARYVYGTVQMPIDQVINWVGVTTPEAALQVLGQGGIPHAGVVQGGVLTAVKLEHLWVDAWVDFFPSRGARHVQGDTWIPLDASFKPSQATAGQAPQTLVQEGVEPVAAAVLEPVRLSAEGALVTGVDLGPLTPLWQDTLQRLLGAYPPATPLGAVLGQRTIIPSVRPVLAAGLPYTPIVRGGTQRALLPAQRHHVHLALFATPLSGPGASAVLTYTLSLPALQMQRLAVTYEPATPADAALLDSLQAQGAAVLPVYLLQARPLLQLDGVTVASGPPLPLGQRVEWQVHLPGPQDPTPAPVLFRGVVGDEQVFALNGSGMVPATVQARLAQPGPRTPAEDLHLTALQYWLGSDALTTLTAQLQGARVMRLPSIALVAQPLTVTTLLGLPYTGTYEEHRLDVGQSLLAVAAPDAATRRAVVLQSGLQGSSLAGAVFDSALGRPQGTSRSAVSLLALAHQQGLPLALLTADTVAPLLPQLQIPPALATALRAAVDAGYQVLVPVQPPPHGAATALGYVVLDPLTGAGAYVLASGVRGGEQLACQAHLRPTTAAALSSALATGLADFALPTTALLDATTVVGLTSVVGLTPLVPALATALDSRPALLGDLAALLAIWHVWQHTLVALDVVATASAADCATDTTPPVVTLSGVPPLAAVGRPIVLTVTATDDSRVATLVLRVNDLPQPLDAASRATYTPPAVGAYTVVAVAQDSAGNTGQAQATFVAVDAAQDTEPPVITLTPLTPPTEDAPVTAPTVIRGTVADATLVRWTLEVAPRGEDQWTLLASGTTPVSDGALATFDPTLLLNDFYELRLTATDVLGRASTTTQVVLVTGHLKIGHHSFTIEDLTLPVVGLPLTIARTYDSRDVRRGDFGAGWRLDLNSLRVRENGVLGSKWQQGRVNTFTYCVEPEAPHSVAVFHPDGRTEVFDVQLAPACQTLYPLQETTVTLVPRAGTFSQLTALLPPEVLVIGTLGTGVGTFAPVELQQIDATSTGGLFDPARYRLTTAEGLVLALDQSVGVQRITEPNGNTVTIGTGGILHSAGPSVMFSRDAQGRITQITDPNGHTISYTYDAAGDLVAVTDQEGHTTRYTYDGTHKLTAILDPRGVTVARTLYDEAGRVIAHLDAAGHRIDYTHDLAGRQEIITDRLGQPTRYTYDERGNVLRHTDPLGHPTTFTYDARDNVLSETNPLGNTTTWTYDERGNRLSVTDALGHTIRWTYNTRGQILTETDPLGQSTTSTYDSGGNLLTMTDPTGATTTHTYSASGRLVAVSNGLGQTVTLASDAAGHVLRRTDSLGRTTHFTYDANGNRLSATRTRTEAQGQVVAMTTTMHYDGHNRLIRSVDPAGAATSIAYNALGKQAVVTDRLGHPTAYAYSPQGALTTITAPDGTTERRTYDANGRQRTVTDRAGWVTTFTYDAAGRLTQLVLPDGATTTATYDAVGRLLTRTDAAGATTTFTYDAAHRQTTLTDALGLVTTFSYDAAGNLRTQTDAHGQTTTYDYNARNQRIRQGFPNGTTTSMTSDALGRPVTVTDQAGATTQLAYEGGSRRLTRVRDALGQETTWTYDAVGNTMTRTNANGHTTHWAYDHLGRVVQHTLPLGMSASSTYDAVGNRRRVTDFTGQTTTFTYDTMQRVTTVTYPDATTVAFTYTPTGQRAAVTEARGITTYAYDARDRLQTITAPEGTTLSYTYDAVGNRTSVTTPTGTTTYRYDALQRLTTVLAPGGDVTTMTATDTGHRDRVTLPSGVRTQYHYDARDRLVALEHRDPQGQILASVAYTLGPTGNRLRAVEAAGRVVTYTYDLLSQLRTETIVDPAGVSQTIAYTYDAVGNRLSRTDAAGTVLATYDANDRLLTVGTTVYTSDPNGQMVRADTPGGSTTYGYDAAHRLTTVQTPQAALTYRYDVDGLRWQSEVNGVVTTFLTDPNRPVAQVLEERASDGIVLARSVYDDMGRLRTERGNDHLYYHGDGLGSTRALTDATGTLLATYAYDAFGTLLHATGNTATPYLFAGEAYEAATQLYYLRARYYAPDVGRFLTPDPMEGRDDTPITLHPYLYARNNPVLYIDPNGTFSSLNVGVAAAVLGSLLGGGMKGYQFAPAGILRWGTKVKQVYLNFADFQDTIGTAYDAETIKDMIFSIVTSDFAPYDLTIMRTFPFPTRDPYKVVHFGLYHVEDFGIEVFGRWKEVAGITPFLGSSAWVLSRRIILPIIGGRGQPILPQQLQIYQLARTASHEIGHMYGLPHAEAASSIMCLGGESCLPGEAQSWDETSRKRLLAIVGRR